jgi:PAS domain S-box-containing protein
MALSRERLQRLVDRSTDIVVATDRKGTVVYYNDGAQNSLGYRPEEVLGTFVGRLYSSVDEAKRVMECMRGSEHGKPGSAESVQTTFVTADGESIPVAISGTILYDENGEEDGTIGFAKDLREILRKDQLATLGEIAVGLSHEINNPLAVIVNQVTLLERDIERISGDRDCSVELERCHALRREVSRIAEILRRLGEMSESETYETVDYIGPAKMVDLRSRQQWQRDERLNGLRILVVDDDPGICATLKEILEASGCEVETAGDGREALERLDQGGLDLVLSDVVMPNMDGHELYLAVHERFPHLPVLMMTAFHYDKDHIIKRSRMQGLEGVIFKKPVDPGRLIQVIAETLKR